jgi:hypothetical protein
MKLSRVAVLVSTAVLSVVLVGFSVLNYQSAEAAGSKKPVTPYKFESLAEIGNAKISIDRSTVFARLDDDEDLQVGAVIQIEVNMPDGAKTLIDAVVAVCGYDGLLIIKGRTYNDQGVQESESEKPLPMKADSPTTPAGIIYRHLCTSAPKPTKPDPRYKAPQSYTKFWT